MSNIHPNAIVDPKAKIGKNVTIEAYAVVKGTVTLHDGVVVKSHAYIDGNTTIGENTTIWPSAVIGTRTQDLKFRGEKTFVEIGKNCHIREFATINSSCKENSVVRVGDDCLIMAYCHVAHNCEIGEGVIMANNAMLAGHVIVEKHVIIGGMTPVHQFVRIGCYSMVGGFSRITHDIPPYTVGAGTPYKLGGLNLIGLKRHNFLYQTRKSLTHAFKLTYRSGLHPDEALGILEREEVSNEYVKHWIDFCRNSRRGLIGLQGVTRNSLGEFEENPEEDGSYDAEEELEEGFEKLLKK